MYWILTARPRSKLSRILSHFHLVRNLWNKNNSFPLERRILRLLNVSQRSPTPKPPRELNRSLNSYTQIRFPWIIISGAPSREPKGIKYINSFGECMLNSSVNLFLFMTKLLSDQYLYLWLHFYVINGQLLILQPVNKDSIIKRKETSILDFQVYLVSSSVDCQE